MSQGFIGNKKGEKIISNSTVKVFPYKKETRLMIKLFFPEFTWKCQEQAYPDFARITIKYIPDKKVLELKSLKLWLNSYRDKYFGYEKLASEVFETIWTTLKPKKLYIHLDVNPRGNMKTDIVMKRKQPCESIPQSPVPTQE